MTEAFGFSIRSWTILTNYVLDRHRMEQYGSNGLGTQTSVGSFVMLLLAAGCVYSIIDKRDNKEKKRVHLTPLLSALLL